MNPEIARLRREYAGQPLDETQRPTIRWCSFGAGSRKRSAPS